MLTLRKILFPDDFSRCAEQAYAHALHLARHHGAELHVLHVQALYEAQPEVPERLASFVASAATYGVQVVTEQVRAVSAAVGILDYAQQREIDLIVMGTHGHRGLGHVFLGSVAEEVVRLAPCPVFTIRERKEARPADAVERILVPVDFSRYARYALRCALDLAALYKARLQLLHVVFDVRHPSFYNPGLPSLLGLLPDLEHQAREELETFLRETAPEAQADVQVVRGHPALHIASFAKENNTDLIVLATHGLTGLDHLLIGSVAEKVVRRAPCPVFTVKPFGRSLLPPEESEQETAGA